MGPDRLPRTEEAEEAEEASETRQHPEPLLEMQQRTRPVLEEEGQIDERTLGVPQPLLLPLLGQEEEQAERDEEEEEGAFECVCVCKNV